MVAQKKYYEGGKQVFQTTEYKDDKMHGMQVKYRPSGAVMSEARLKMVFHARIKTVSNGQHAKEKISTDCH
jgi:antitoxin component YwqK of YwqJK toxin-antitoxin module